MLTGLPPFYRPEGGSATLQAILKEHVRTRFPAGERQPN